MLIEHNIIKGAKAYLLFFLLWHCLGYDWGKCARAAKKEAELTRLADGVYVRIADPDGEAVANAGILILERSVLVFDTHFTPEAGKALLQSIRSITAKPINYIVNSHFHPDHTHGNQVFVGAQIIGSLNTRKCMLELDLPSLQRTISITQSQIGKIQKELDREGDGEKKQIYWEQVRSLQSYLDELSQLDIAAPQVAVVESMVIAEGEKTVEIRYLGKGHTEGDLILFLPWAKIAFVGDLFFNEAVPNVQDAVVVQWVETLENILKLDANIFVPGHGPVGDRKAVERFLGYFRNLRSLVEKAIMEGKNAQQLLEETKIPEQYAKYRFQNLFPANVQKMYEELTTVHAASRGEDETVPSKDKKTANKK